MRFLLGETGGVMNPGVGDVTTSPAAFTPFEHLLTASLLAKPLSHRLGMRTMHTFLNAPFDLNSPEKYCQGGGRSALGKPLKLQ